MSLSQVLNLYKEKGETPLERINRFKFGNPEYNKVKMTYAGRLDPMAEGVLLVLSGEEIKNKQNYLNLKKEYETEILFGFSTDSFDALGIVTNDSRREEIEKIEEGFFSQDTLNKFTGKFSQKYPPFSSKTISGKSLFTYVKEGNLVEKDIPEKEVEIFSIEKTGFENISQERLKDKIIESIKMVKGDFRQEEISRLWEESFRKSDTKEFPVLKIKVNCSSGTYIRVLAKNIGLKLFSVPSLALSIKRTSVGKHFVDNSIK